MGSHRELPARSARLLNSGVLPRAARASAAHVVLALAVAGLIALAVLAGAPARIASDPQSAPTTQLQAAEQAPTWSAPATLANCPAQGGASVVFPDESPSHGTGAGALVWEASAGCPGGEGARVAPIGSADLPGESRIPRTSAGAALELHGPLLASGAPHGQVLIAGYSPQLKSAGVLLQGPAGGPFATLSPSGGASAPIALATAYLGDVALAAPPLRSGHGHAGASLHVHVERFFARGFDRSASAGSVADGPVQSPTLALDYRSEALAVWVQAGTIYAQLLPATGSPAPIQTLAHTGTHVTISALLSDDDRAIVAWAQQTGDHTAIYLDRSAAGVSFHEPELIERFHDPAGLASPPGSPRLVRLSFEGVMMAWAGEAGGRWVLRGAPIDLHGIGSISTLAAADGQALLADLAPGPHGDALALWTVPATSAGGHLEVDRQTLYAARVTDAPSRRTEFGEPEELAAAAPVAGASATFDPDSGRAVVAWQGQGGAIEYSIGSDSPAPVSAAAAQP